MLDRVSGRIDWSINVNVLAPGTLAWVFESTMKGAAVDLPAPLGKSAGDEMPLRIEGRDEASPPGTDFDHRVVWPRRAVRRAAEAGRRQCG